MSVRRRASGRALYNYFRDYDSTTGKYSQSDPIGLSGGMNTTTYVSNTPIDTVDPFGLTDVIYNDGAHTLTVIDSGGNARSFPAGNNVARNSRGPCQPGQYQFAYYVPHSPDPNGPYGSNGNFVFNVPGCNGCGIHSGRANRSDRRGRRGVEHATEGCIRTTDEATDLLNELRLNGDPIRNLTVIRVAPPPVAVPAPGIPPTPPIAPVPGTFWLRSLLRGLR